MHNDKTDVWTGLFVLIGVAALLFLAMQSANLLQVRWHKGYQVIARFDNVGGLKPRAAVRSSGVVVGRVAAITFDDDSYQAKVVLDMDSTVQFPENSALKIQTSGLLGEQYIAISAGSDTAMWKQGSVAMNTQSAMVLEDLIGQFIYGKAGAADSSGTAKEKTVR